MPHGSDAPGGVEAQVAVDERRRKCRTRSPGERANAGDELGEVERLGQVVVGAEPEALHAVGDAARRSQHEDATLAVVGHQATADLVAVDAGNVAVQNDDVVARGRAVAEGVGTVKHDVDRHALAAQARGQRHRQLGVVFDQQHSHRFSWVNACGLCHQDSRAAVAERSQRYRAATATCVEAS